MTNRDNKKDMHCTGLTEAHRGISGSASSEMNAPGLTLQLFLRS